jgi:Acyl-CoA dehydrogenase, C-terminal domain
VFGKFLSQNGLHLRTLTNLSVQLRWTTHFVFFIISLLGKTESSSSPSPSESLSPSTSLSDARLLLRLLTPVLKATLAKTGIAFLSECMESLGGQGYVEEGGIGVLYRDTQVNAIWEGTTNVLADDMLRVLRGRSSTATWDALDGYISRNIENAEKVVRSGTCRRLGTFPRRLRGVYERWRGGMMREEGVVRIHAREMVLLLGRIVGAVEMMGDAMRDGDEIEMECCERIFEFEKQGWDIDAVTSLKMDQRIVFGEEVAGTGTVQAKL